MNSRATTHPTPCSGRPSLRLTRRSALTCSGWSAAILAFTVPELLPLTPMFGESRPGMVVVVLGSLLQITVLVGIAIAYRQRAARRVVPPPDVVPLGYRIEWAEEELARDRELLHELRSAVAGIATSHRLLHDGTAQLPPDRRGHLERLQDTEVTRLEHLLGGPSADEPGPVELSVVIDPFVECLRMQGHDVRWSDTDLVAWASRDGLFGVLEVLLENAVRHAGGHGVEVSAHRAGEDVQLRVRDHGPGVDPAVLPHLFDRGARRRDSPGQGLGLSIAQRLAHQMGARLHVEPADPGAAFVLSMPARTGALSCLGLSG